MAKAAVAIKVDGVADDLNRPLAPGGALEIITENTDEGRIEATVTTAWLGRILLDDERYEPWLQEDAWEPDARWE